MIILMIIFLLFLTIFFFVADILAHRRSSRDAYLILKSIDELRKDSASWGEEK